MPPVPKLVYIAKQLGTARNQHKPGRTHRLIVNREAELRGQADAEFEVLRTFKTKCEVTAERIAFAEIDARGFRKYPGTRKETVVCDFDVLVAIMQRAAIQADKIYDATGMAQREAFLQRRDEAPPSVDFKVPTAFLRKVLEAPVLHKGVLVPIKTVMRHAVTCHATRKRMEKKGVRVLACLENKTDFEIAWPYARDMVKWMSTQGLELPLEPITRFQLKHA